MSLLIKGITKLSELSIDAAKDWAGQNLSNIGTLATTGFGDFNSLKIGGTEVISSARVLADVTANASIITTGTFGTTRLDLSALAQDILPSAADARSLGSATKEWLNVYIGDAGKLYFGLAQDVNLYYSASNVLKTDDSFTCSVTINTNALRPNTMAAGDNYVSMIPSSGQRVWSRYRYGGGGPDPAGVLFSGYDTDNYYFSADSNNFYIKYHTSLDWSAASTRVTLTGAGVLQVAGHLGVGGATAATYPLHVEHDLAEAICVMKNTHASAGRGLYVRVDNPDATKFSFAILHGGTYMFKVHGDGKLRIGNDDTNLYRSAANVLKTDDAFDAASLKIGGTEVFNIYRDATVRYFNISGTGNHIRCNTRIQLRNAAATAYQDIEVKRLFIGATCVIDDGRNVINVGTIDGVDVAAHVADIDAHHKLPAPFVKGSGNQVTAGTISVQDMFTFSPTANFVAFEFLYGRLTSSDANSDVYFKIIFEDDSEDDLTEYKTNAAETIDVTMKQILTYLGDTGKYIKAIHLMADNQDEIGHTVAGTIYGYQH